jgi:hypothetical protein
MSGDGSLKPRTERGPSAAKPSKDEIRKRRKLERQRKKRGRQ